MEKGINLQAKIHIGSDAQAAANLQQSLPARFAADNPGLALTVKHISPPDDKGDVAIRIYVEGDQDPASDFAALTRGAIHKTIASMNSDSGKGVTATTGSPVSGGAGSQSPVHIKDLQETEGDDENTGVTLAPTLQAQATSSAAPAPPSPASTPSQPPPTAASTPQAQQPAAASRTSPWWAFWKRGR